MRPHRLRRLRRRPDTRPRVEAAVVGTGPNPRDPSASGRAMGYHHAAGYRRLRGVDLVACADLVPAHARRFAASVGIPPSGVFTSTAEMLARTEPDVVSVCVPPAAHAGLVVQCARTASVRAVHCEKPMATTWRDCLRMVEVCEAEGVQLTFNHQRRFSVVTERAKRLLDEGAIGRLVRVEIGGKNLFDYGTHLFDLCRLFTDGEPVERVHASVDYAQDNQRYGAPQETWALAQWRYRDGVVGLASTGDGSLLNCQLRLVGSEGTLEVGHDGGPPLRHRRRDEEGWTVVDTRPDAVNGPVSGWGLVTEVARRTGVLQPGTPTPRWLPGTLVERAIADVVASVDVEEPSPLSGASALASTELVFACWESARRGGAVTLPLDIEDNPLESMIAAGRFAPGLAGGTTGAD